MKQNNKKYRQPRSFLALKSFLRFFKRKRKIYNENGSLDGPAIFVANHSGASGPMDLSLYFPTFLIPWGTYQMRGKFKERWHYLYDVFYRQKLKYGKVRSWILATLLGTVAPFLYGNMRVIRTYDDIRLVRTFKESITHLKENVSLLIFPEDSSDGYSDEIAVFNEGFVAFADYYYKNTGVDLPIYPVYYNKKRAFIRIGKFENYSSFIKKGYTRGQIAEYFRTKLNNLGKRSSLE